MFGVSAMYGRVNASMPWDSSNAEMLFRYTVEKNYSVYAFEFGKEEYDERKAFLFALEVLLFSSFIILSFLRK